MGRGNGILKESEHASKMGQTGRKTLEEKYNLEIMQQRIFEMYNDVMKKKFR